MAVWTDSWFDPGETGGFNSVGYDWETNPAGDYRRIYAGIDSRKSPFYDQAQQFYGGAGAGHDYLYQRKDASGNWSNVSPGEHREEANYLWSGVNSPQYQAALSGTDPLSKARVGTPGALGQSLVRDPTVQAGFSTSKENQELAYLAGGGLLGKYGLSLDPAQQQLIDKYLAGSTPGAQDSRDVDDNGMDFVSLALMAYGLGGGFGDLGGLLGGGADGAGLGAFGGGIPEGFNFALDPALWGETAASALGSSAGALTGSAAASAVGGDMGLFNVSGNNGLMDWFSNASRDFGEPLGQMGNAITSPGAPVPGQMLTDAQMSLMGDGFNFLDPSTWGDIAADAIGNGSALSDFGSALNGAVDLGGGMGGLTGGSSWIDSLISSATQDPLGSAGKALKALSSSGLLGTAVGGLLGATNGSKQAGVTTTTTEPWAGQQPFLLDAFRKAQEAANGSPLQTQAKANYASVLSGPTKNPMLGMDNPYLTTAIDNANSDVTRAMMPMMNQANQASGSFGNSGVADQFGKSMAEQYGRNATNMRMQDYTNQQQLQQANVQNTLGFTTGANDFVAKPAQNYAQTIQGNYGGSTSTPYFTNPMANILGGATIGNKIGSLWG